MIPDPASAQRLEELLEHLHDPAAYPEGPREVRVLQTHISIVCLAGDRVYKLKKPLQLPFLDFSTPALREHFCREELHLNQRLCPDVYLDVVPLWLHEHRYGFAQRGRVVDHAVLMRRLPQERMLDELLAAGAVDTGHIEAIARTLLPFHRRNGIRPAPGEPGRPERLAEFMTANFRETGRFAGTVFDPDLHRALAHRTQEDLAALQPRLLARIAAGRVVHGHGDLHARNICMTDPPAIYDCVEFDAELRCGDVAVENAFLVMDLAYRGHRELAGAFVRAYCEASGDDEQPALLPPLFRYRAMVRAKVAALATEDPGIGAQDRKAAAASAQRHLALAAASAVAEDGPLWLLACGLPASGKSHVFGQLAAETGWPCFASDRIRKELAGIAPDQHAPEGSYEPAAVARVYGELLRRADAATRGSAAHDGGGPVLLDATFRAAAERRRAAEAAAAAGARLCTVFFDVGDATARRRLRARGRENPSDAGLEVYEAMRAGFERPGADEPAVRVDADAPARAQIDRILAALLGGRGG